MWRNVGLLAACVACLVTGFVFAPQQEAQAGQLYNVKPIDHPVVQEENSIIITFHLATGHPDQRLYCTPIVEHDSSIHNQENYAK